MFSTPTTAVGVVVVQMRVKIVVKRKEQGLGVTDEKKVEADNWKHDRGEKNRQVEVVIPLEIKIERDADETADAVIDGPNREQEISGLALVSVATTRASIQRRKVVAQRADFQQRRKNRLGAALNTPQTARSEKISEGSADLGTHGWKFWIVRSMRARE